MKRRSIMYSLTAIFVFGIGLLTIGYLNNRQSAETQNQVSKQSTPKQNNTQSEVVSNQNQPTTQPGSYLPYSETDLAKISGTRVLFFHAPWCPQCRMLDEDLKKASIPDNVTIFKVDYDSNQSLRQKHGVTLQTTFIKLDEEGNTAQKYVAYNEPNFTAVKTNLLQ